MEIYYDRVTDSVVDAGPFAGTDSETQELALDFYCEYDTGSVVLCLENDGQEVELWPA